MTRLLTLLLCGFSMLAGCAKEPPPRTVTEFIDNPIMLEAVMIRCSEDRSKTRYDEECVNARKAVARVQAKEEAAHTAALEASSERKRKALRRTQAAAAEARRRASESNRLREEAEYLSQFGIAPPADGDGDGESGETAVEANLPTASVIEAVEQPASDGDYRDDVPATDGGNAPVAEPEPPSSDLESIRDELRRRNEDGG